MTASPASPDATLFGRGHAPRRPGKGFRSWVAALREESPADPPLARSRTLRVGALLPLLLAGLACAAGSGAPPSSPLEPLPLVGAHVPDALDRAGADAARAALVGDAPAVDRALEEIRSGDEGRRAQGSPPSGLLVYGLDAQIATLGSARERRRADAGLLERKDVPPALRSRIQREIQDDPLRLARARIRDRRVIHYGRIVNSLVEPVGRSIASATLFPYRMALSVLQLVLAEAQEDPLTTPERQALAHWKRFVEENPEAPEAVALLGRIERAQRRWYETLYDHAVGNARDALRAHRWLLATVWAERALHYAPEDPAAQELLSRAEQRGTEWMQARERSLEAAPDAAVGAEQRELAVALLLERGPVESAARALEQRDPEGPLADEAHFARALAAGERGDEAGMWKELEALAHEGGRSNMARYARVLLDSPYQNPWRAFQRARRTVLAERGRWLLLGPLAKGPHRRHLPRSLEWLLELPNLAGVAMGLPGRLLRAPVMRLDWKRPAVWARQYLRRYARGQHAEEARSWLIHYERKRGNPLGALRLAEQGSALGDGELRALREDAAEQALRGSQHEKSRAVRIQLLRETARRFPQTEAGRKAGSAARREMDQWTPQRIRITRGFLKENPRVAGPEGLALQPGLLDGKLSNGELHREGVALLGGRMLQISFVGRSEGDPPIRQRERISKERMARLVAQLEEASLHQLRTDHDARVEYDADRDLFFERARLGLLDHPDTRGRAGSDYVFRSMRERYGIVRSREPILPVEIVVKGNLTDLGLGAFPRIRMPKSTPDAILYK